MKVKRLNIGNHRVIFAREPMMGFGFDIGFPKYLSDDLTSEARSWRVRLWFGPFILSVSFNVSAYTMRGRK
jgi:hypothetical protein